MSDSKSYKNARKYNNTSRTRTRSKFPQNTFHGKTALPVWSFADKSAHKEQIEQNSIILKRLKHYSTIKLF